jgi:hypothetical protein
MSTNVQEIEIPRVMPRLVKDKRTGGQLIAWAMSDLLNGLLVSSVPWLLFLQVVAHSYLR